MLQTDISCVLYPISLAMGFHLYVIDPESRGLFSVRGIEVTLLV